MRAASAAIVLAVLAGAPGARPLHAGVEAAAQRNAAPAVPGDPAIGAWRGTIRTAAEAPTPFLLSIVKRGDTYDGAINLGGANEIAVRRVAVAGTRVTIESGAESRIGTIALAAELTLDGNTLGGVGTLSVGPLPTSITIELRRQPRADVLQPVVEQRVAYFVGHWRFEYLGGEFPPLSPGSRAGTAIFTSTSPETIAGVIDAMAGGTPHREQWSMTFDAAAHTLAVVERRAGGPELLSVANWQTPLAIRFTTAPLDDGGRRYQLRRLLRIVSDVSFIITEEFSVDGAPFHRLGQATFERAK
jgi:hypothetical protein